MRFQVRLAAVAAAFAVTLSAASAQVSSGATVNGALVQDLSSNHAYVGEPVTLMNVTSANGSGNVYHAKLFGHVTAVRAAGQGRAAQLQMQFVTLVLPNGAYYGVNTTVVGMNTVTKNNTLKEAGGALAGMIVGNAIGKTLFHASGGGLVGLAGGYLIARNNRQNMDIAPGSVISVRLNSVVRKQSH